MSATDPTAGGGFYRTSSDVDADLDALSADDHERGRKHMSTNVDPDATDPTAGERDCACPTRWISSGGGHVCQLATPAEPDAGDVEALAQMLFDLPPHGTSITIARAVLASDWLDAVRRKAGDERAEQIAQAIEAGSPRDGCTCESCDTYRDAARIARESR